MIYGTECWKNTSIRYDQTKRIIEKFLADLKESKQTNFWLESCNVCASCCAVESVNGTWKLELPRINGRAFMSQADLLFNYIYSLDFVKADGICDNEVMEHLSIGIQNISDVKADVFYVDSSTELIKNIKDSLKNSKSIVLSYKTDYESYHYINIVAYDTVKDLFYCYDSWANNKHCKNGGKLETYNSTFFKKRARLRYMEVYKKCQNI